MPDRSTIDRVLAANRYCTLGTVDQTGRPWVTPVFFAPLDDNRICWVSAPDSRHSRNITDHPAAAVTVFDSTVAVGTAEAAYFDTDASVVPADEAEAALQALNARLPERQELSIDDVHPNGPMVIYQAHVQHRYVLIRGGDPEHGNTLDMSLEV